MDPKTPDRASCVVNGGPCARAAIICRTMSGLRCTMQCSAACVGIGEVRARSEKSRRWLEGYDAAQTGVVCAAEDWVRGGSARLLRRAAIARILACCGCVCVLLRRSGDGGAGLFRCRAQAAITYMLMLRKLFSALRALLGPRSRPRAVWWTAGGRTADAGSSQAPPPGAVQSCTTVLLRAILGHERRAKPRCPFHPVHL